MKVIYYTLISCFILIFSSSLTYAVVPVQKTENQEQAVKESAEKAFHKLSKKKQNKFKKRLAKLKNKLEKKVSPDNGVLDDGKFRLGAVVFLAGLAVGLLASLIFGFGFISWVAGIAVLVGVILMAWSAIEYYG